MLDYKEREAGFLRLHSCFRAGRVLRCLESAPCGITFQLSRRLTVAVAYVIEIPTMLASWVRFRPRLIFELHAQKAVFCTIYGRT